MSCFICMVRMRRSDWCPSPMPLPASLFIFWIKGTIYQEPCYFRLLVRSLKPVGLWVDLLVLSWMMDKLKVAQLHWTTIVPKKSQPHWAEQNINTYVFYLPQPLCPASLLHAVHYTHYIVTHAKRKHVAGNGSVRVKLAHTLCCCCGIVSDYTTLLVSHLRSCRPLCYHTEDFFYCLCEGLATQA